MTAGSSLERIGREPDELRPLTLERGAAPYAEGSCLIATGRTRVLCTASVQDGVPDWRRGTGGGWVTAEYAMLPRATSTRSGRERGRVGGRTQEIQRLIGRALRAAADLVALGDRTIIVDCDVLVADGGTRTAAITGAAVALHDACQLLVQRGDIPLTPLRELVAATSVGVVAGQLLLDLEYREDVAADVDLNLVALESGRLVEIQGTAERQSFSTTDLQSMVDLASRGIRHLIHAQHACIAG